MEQVLSKTAPSIYKSKLTKINMENIQNSGTEGIREWIILNLQPRARYIGNLLGSTENLDLKRNFNVAFWFVFDKITVTMKL